MRLLLANFTVAYVAEIVSRYLLVVALLASHFTGSLVGPTLYCRLSRALHDVAVFVSFFDVIALAIERTIATIAAHTYEGHQSTIVGVLLVLVQVRTAASSSSREYFQWTSAVIFIWLNQTDPNIMIVASTPCQTQYFNSDILRIFNITFVVADVTAVFVSNVLMPP